MSLLRQVFAETYRVLVNGGRACVNVANLGRRPYLPLSDFISNMMLEIGFQMRGEIIWHKGAGAGVSMAWGSWQSASNPVLRDVHEYILVFSKGSFSRKKIAGQENTISKEQFMEWTKSVWSMIRNQQENRPPSPSPMELPYRLIQLYTFTGDIILRSVYGQRHHGDGGAAGGKEDMWGMKMTRSMCNWRRGGLGLGSRGQQFSYLSKR